MVGVNGGGSCHDNEIKPGQLALMESETLPDQAFDAVAVTGKAHVPFGNGQTQTRIADAVGAGQHGQPAVR